MEWNELQQKWLMKMRRSKIMLQEFFDCNNVRKYFKGLNKSIPQSYELIIRKLILLFVLLMPLAVFAQDTTPPVGKIDINKDSKFVTSRFVPLTILANDNLSGVVSMCISNTDTCTSWQPYQKDVLWVLSEGNGIKTVHVWIVDLAGNMSHTTDYIRLWE